MNLRIHAFKVILGCVSLALILSACAPKVPTASPDEILTSVELTVESDFTKTAIAKPTSTPTLAPTVTNTPTPITPTTAATNTPVSATATVPVSVGADKGVWVSSSPADGTEQHAGKEFKVVLTLMNTGTSTWTTSYAIKFSSGSRMGAPETISMPYDVPPTKTVQFNITFTAPDTLGNVRGDWKIVNASGNAFANFYCEYKVVQAE